MISMYTTPEVQRKFVHPSHQTDSGYALTLDQIKSISVPHTRVVWETIRKIVTHVALHTIRREYEVENVKSIIPENPDSGYFTVPKYRLWFGHWLEYFEETGQVVALGIAELPDDENIDYIELFLEIFPTAVEYVAADNTKYLVFNIPSDDLTCVNADAVLFRHLEYLLIQLDHCVMSQS